MSKIILRVENEELADYAIEIGQNEGASYVDARLIKSRDESVAARNGMILSAQEKTRSGIGIRVIADGGMAFGSTETLSRERFRTSHSVVD